MKKCVTGIWILIVLAGLAVSFCQAKTAYVSDVLILTFREGPGTNYNVLQTLKSNTPLTILREENGFYLVELTTGGQGWVDKQFVIFDLPKTMIIDKLKQEKSSLETQIKRLKEGSSQDIDASNTRENLIREKAQILSEKTAALQQENKQLIINLKQAKNKFDTLKQTSKNISATLEENKRLKTENATLSVTIQRLENETSHIFRTGMIKWFLAGFGVLLIGWIIGKSASPKKRRGSSLLD